MDAVITYVDGLDPVWQQEYREAVGTEINAKRFRDWGTLKYLLRGIENCMPFVDNVYLVVSSESQVPAWVDKEKTKVVLHRDIIPAEYLPVFNSTAIEMFLHRIPDLDERFIYFNDDFFPVSDCKREDFFTEDKVVMKHSRHLFALDLFKKQVKNSDRLARKAASGPCSMFFMRPQHISSPMLKSRCEELFDMCRGKIEASISTLREEKNYNQYIFTDYLYFKGLTLQKRLSKKHFSLAASRQKAICEAIEHPTVKFLCINDVKMSDERYRTLREAILTSFERRFPHKSRFES